MIGKPVALIQVSNQRLFSTKAAAKYLGVHHQTLRKYADLGMLKVKRLENRRVFTLEDLDSFIEELPEWYPDPDGGPGCQERRGNGN